MADSDKWIDVPNNDATRLLPNSEYIGAWDLNGKEWSLLIRKVQLAQLQPNAIVKKAQQKGLLFFSTSDGKPWGKKGLLCGSTIIKLIAVMHGRDTSRWVGKAITIFPTTWINQKGQEAPCVRVRPKPPSSATSEAAPDVAPDESMMAAQAAALQEHQ